MDVLFVFGALPDRTVDIPVEDVIAEGFRGRKRIDSLAGMLRGGLEDFEVEQGLAVVPAPLRSCANVRPLGSGTLPAMRGLVPSAVKLELRTGPGRSCQPAGYADFDDPIVRYPPALNTTSPESNRILWNSGLCSPLGSDACTHGIRPVCLNY